MHAFAISKISFRSLLSFTLTPNGFRKYIRCDNELNRFMSVHSWVQLHDTVFFVVVPCSFRFKNVYSLCVSSFLNRICKRVLVVYECVCVLLLFFFCCCRCRRNVGFFRVCVCVYTVLLRNNGNRYKRIAPHIGFSPFEHCVSFTSAANTNFTKYVNDWKR